MLLAVVISLGASLGVISGSLWFSAQTQPSQTQPSLDRVVVRIVKGSAINTSLTFEPATAVLIIGVNSSVVWVNEDSAPHTVHSNIPEFDSGIIPPGGEFHHRFTKPGVYPYHCHLHPWKTGTIIVKEGG
jgi:plastocyanin